MNIDFKTKFLFFIKHFVYRPKQCLFKFSNALESSSDILDVSIYYLVVKISNVCFSDLNSIIFNFETKLNDIFPLLKLF